MAPRSRRAEADAGAYDAMTLTELRERAREADVAGRSNMSREELIATLQGRES